MMILSMSAVDVTASDDWGRMGSFDVFRRTQVPTKQSSMVVGRLSKNEVDAVVGDDTTSGGPSNPSGPSGQPTPVAGVARAGSWLGLFGRRASNGSTAAKRNDSWKSRDSKEVLNEDDQKKTRRPKQRVSRRQSVPPANVDDVAERPKARRPYHRSASMPGNPADAAQAAAAQAAQSPESRRPMRRPSIPTSIDEGRCSLHRLLASNSAHGGGDNDTVVSEVTMMTYSDEKAELVKEEFFRRLAVIMLRKNIEKINDVPMEEKEELLQQVQYDIENKFEEQKQAEKEARRLEEQDAEVERDCFERLASSRLEKEHNLSDRRLSGDLVDDAESIEELKMSPSRTGGDNPIDQSDATRQVANVRPKPGNRRGSLASLAEISTARRTSLGSEYKRRSSVESCRSEATAKRSNHSASTMNSIDPNGKRLSDRSIADGDVSGDDNSTIVDGLLSESPHTEEKEDSFDEGTRSPQTMSASNERQRYDPEALERSYPSLSNTTSSAGTVPHIDQIIELKMLVANQQATIDTLYSRMHNLEVENKRLRAAENSRAEELKQANQRLERRLEEYKQREEQLRNECLEQSTRSAPLSAPLGASLSGVASPSHSIFRRSRSNNSLQGRVPPTSSSDADDLTRENEDLRRELAELQSQMRTGDAAAGGAGARYRRRDSNETQGTARTTRTGNTTETGASHAHTTETGTSYAHTIPSQANTAPL